MSEAAAAQAGLAWCVRVVFLTKDFKKYRLQSYFSYKLSLAPRTQRNSLQSWQIVKCLRDLVQERTHAIVRRKG